MATTAEMAKMLADLEWKMGPSLPASILVRTQLEEAKMERDGAEPLLEKIQAAEKPLKTHLDAVEALTAKRDHLQHSLQAAQDKLHEAHSLRREQEAELMDLRGQVAADLPLAAATPVRSEEGRKTIMEALDALSRGNQQQLQEPMRVSLAEVRQWVATTTTPPSPSS